MLSSAFIPVVMLSAAKRCIEARQQPTSEVETDRNYWVYILECSDGSYYTGVTSDLEKRLSQHRLGIVKGYTSTRLPVKLVFNECFYEVYDAISAEKQIKRWSRAKKEALIRGDFEALKVLAKKKWKKKT